MYPYAHHSQSKKHVFVKWVCLHLTCSCVRSVFIFVYNGRILDQGAFTCSCARVIFKQTAGGETEGERGLV